MISATLPPAVLAASLAHAGTSPVVVGASSPEPAADFPATLPLTGLSRRSPAGLSGTRLQHQRRRSAIRHAEALLTKPFPETSDDLFLQYSKTGDREGWQKVNFDRRGRIFAYALAEALENKGRFIPGYEAAVRAILAEKLWVMPAHDPALKYFRHGEVHIDLGSAELGWTLAESLSFLDAKVFSGVARRRSIRPARAHREAVRRHGFRRRKADWWVDGTNNWNPVCLCGVTGVVLATPRPDADRARLVEGRAREIPTFSRPLSRMTA